MSALMYRVRFAERQPRQLRGKDGGLNGRRVTAKRSIDTYAYRLQIVIHVSMLESKWGMAHRDGIFSHRLGMFGRVAWATRGLLVCGILVSVRMSRVWCDMRTSIPPSPQVARPFRIVSHTNKMDECINEQNGGCGLRFVVSSRPLRFGNNIIRQRAGCIWRIGRTSFVVIIESLTKNGSDLRESVAQSALRMLKIRDQGFRIAPLL